MVFTRSTGAPVLVGSRLAAGGQGEVFAVPYPQEHVFKKYFPGELGKDPTLEHRLRAMVENKPRGWREASGHITMAWPADLVFEDGAFVGFIMPLINMKDTVGIHRITNPSDRRRQDPDSPVSWTPSFTWRYLVRAGINLSQVTESLHTVGTVIGDFNDANVRVGKDARVSLLDCDSMQIIDPVTLERFFCRVGRPDFTPPELVNADWKTTVRHPSGDVFALAVHLYALLLEGEHPFRGVWSGSGDKPSVPELARQGIWAYQDGGPLTPRPAAIGIDLLPPMVRELFRAAFETSIKDPDRRPEAREWYQVLGELEADLRVCSTEPSHVYPRFHGDVCPWCRHAHPPPPSPEIVAFSREWYQVLGELEADLRVCSTEPSHVYPRFHGDDCPWCRHAQPPPPSPEIVAPSAPVYRSYPAIPARPLKPSVTYGVPMGDAYIADDDEYQS